MESSDELKEIDFNKHTCYYLNDKIKVEEFDSENIVLDEKSCKEQFVKKSVLQKFYGEKIIAYFFT